MIRKLRVLAIIPARGGSKGIVGKNIINICGKPLISYTIESASESKYIDDIIVSTDDQKIASISLEYGAEIPFMRPSEIAGDNAKTIDAVIHTINELELVGRCYDVLVLLQPTQPLRTASDIDNALETYIDSRCKSLASVNEVSQHPVLIREINMDNELVPILNKNSTIRRQDMQTYYIVNGCIYINSICNITRETSFNDNLIPFVMKESHSVDIDDYSDLEMANYYLNKR